MTVSNQSPSPEPSEQAPAPKALPSLRGSSTAGIKAFFTEVERVWGGMSRKEKQVLSFTVGTLLLGTSWAMAALIALEGLSGLGALVATLALAVYIVKKSFAPKPSPGPKPESEPKKRKWLSKLF